MIAIRVQIALSDGGWVEQDGTADLLHRFRVLEAHGTHGRELIRALWGDAWTAPPEFIRITGTDDAGRRVDVTVFNDEAG